MKLISRKALVAVAATTALTFSGLTAPAFAEEKDPAGSSFDSSSNVAQTDEDANTDGGKTAKTEGDENTDDTPADTTPADNDGKTEDEPAKTPSGSSEDAKPGEIKDWIGVVTAVIGALSAIFVFAQKFMNN